MSTTLGSAFTPPPTIEPDPDELADLALLAAVQDLTEKVASLELPAPVVNIPAPRVRVDVPPLPAVPTAAEIGAAVANALPADDDGALILAVTSVKDAVDKLAKKTTAPRFGTGGGLGGAQFDSAGNLKVVTSGSPTGGLTDTQLRAAPVPVSGTVSVSNFPSTQPVSIASTVPVSGTFWQATQPVSLATNTPDVTDRAARILGHVTVDNASIPVTGTFFPATQPISATALPLPTGAAQDGTDISSPTAMPPGGAGIRGWLSAIWTKLNGSLAVTGTFWQSTQPVSLATNTPDVTDRAARLLGHVTVDNASIAVTGTFWQATQPVSGTVAVSNFPGSSIVTFKGRACAFRIPGRAGTTGQRLMALTNAIGSGVTVTINLVTIDTVMTVVKAVTVLPPMIRVYRITAVPAGGTTMTKVARDSSLTSNASVTVVGDASADGTNSAVALTAVTTAGAMLTEEFAPRLITAAGYEMYDRTEFFDGHEVTLRAGEGIVVALDYTLATQNPTTDMWAVGIDWSEA